MHSQTASHRIALARADQLTVSRAIEDQARVGEWLSGHPRFASALGRIASTDKFMDAYAFMKPVEAGLAKEQPATSEHVITLPREVIDLTGDVAAQNFMSITQKERLENTSLPHPVQRAPQKVA